MMDYDIESANVNAAVALTPGIEGPTDRAASSRGLGGRAGDGPARRRPAADGRAVRPRCPRHPAHRHPCLPALTAGRCRRLPHTWRPFGVRMAGTVVGAGLLVVCALAWIGFDDETQAKFSWLQRATVLALGLFAFALWFALVRSRVVAEAERLVVVNGYRQARVRLGTAGRCPAAAGRAVGHPRPGRRHHGRRHGHPGLRRRPRPYGGAPAPRDRRAADRRGVSYSTRPIPSAVSTSVPPSSTPGTVPSRSPAPGGVLAGSSVRRTSRQP